MADIFDQTQDRLEREEELRALARPLDPLRLAEGEPGECELCGEWSGRLVNGACAPCRDRYRLP